MFVFYTFLLSGCANNSRQSSAVGPSPSSSFSEQETAEIAVTTPTAPKLDVIIPVFDPGLPEDPEDYESENIWPELRRAEANRFAFKLKEALEETEQFGSIRVTPDKSATGDLYILGRIEQSNGEEVEVEIKVIDISGERWLKESFEYEVSSAFHKDIRNRGKDSYDPLFVEIAAEIVEELKDHESEELEDLRYLTDIRFGASFSDSTFMQYLETDDEEYTLVSKPSDNDPMLQRVKEIRVRDQLFIDNLQDNYAAFSAQMNDSYLMWQEQSLLEVKARRSAGRKAILQMLGGALLVGLAVLSVTTGSRSSSSSIRSLGSTGAILGGIGGVSMISAGFKTSNEAKVHRDALNELGQSVNMELGSQVVAFDEESVELTGDAKEQFMQWRNFLQKIYTEEKTPDVQF
jgi:hypothetical protein